MGQYQSGETCDQAYQLDQLPALGPIEFERVPNKDIDAARDVFERMQRMRDSQVDTANKVGSDDGANSITIRTAGGGLSLSQQKFLLSDLCDRSSEYLLEVHEFRELVSEWLFTLYQSFEKAEKDRVVLGTLDLIMQGAYGVHNHAYLLLSFEGFFVDGLAEGSEEVNAYLENFANDFCSHQVPPQVRHHRDNQA